MLVLLLVVVAGLGLAVRAGWPLALEPRQPELRNEAPANVEPEATLVSAEQAAAPLARLAAQASYGDSARVRPEAAELVSTADAESARVGGGSSGGSRAERSGPLVAEGAYEPQSLLPITEPVDRPELKPLPSRTPATGPAVALTFDAGADRGYAEDILDALRAADVPASFGVTGRWAEENPDLVRRMAADGHQVINHTLDHRSFTGLSDELGGLPAARRRQELEQADAILAPLVGHTTRPWYRLPYGDDAEGISTDVAAIGFTRKAGWTIDSLGWRGLAAGDIVARCLKLAEPDAVYVFHVGHTSQDGPALARIIAGIRERGLGFATLESLE